jgi:hypothetical protein
MNASFYYSDDYVTLDPGFSGIASQEGFVFSDIFGSANMTFALSANPAGKKAYACGYNTIPTVPLNIVSYLGIGATNRQTYTQIYFTPILSAYNGSSIFSPVFTKISPTFQGALGQIGTALYAAGDDAAGYNLGKGNQNTIFTRVMAGPIADFEAGFYGSFVLDNSTPPVVYYSGYGDAGGWNPAGQGTGANASYQTFTALGQYLPGYTYVKGDSAMPTVPGTGPLSTFLPYNNNRSIAAKPAKSLNLASWMLATPQGNIPAGYAPGKYLMYVTGNNFYGQLGIGYKYASRPLWTCVLGVCATNQDVQRADVNAIFPAWFTKLYDSSSDPNAGRCFARGFDTDGGNRWYVAGDVSGGKGGVTVTASGNVRKANQPLHWTPIESADTNPGVIFSPDFDSVHIAPKFTAARLARAIYITGQFSGFGLPQANYTQFTRLTSLDYNFNISTTSLGVLVLRSS